ncbi:hypothetical protein NEOC65_000423 [Neochlamydia sp. AcF65]|nr:hypothetical protein [Neochlamydia sp. AcF65]
MTSPPEDLKKIRGNDNLCRSCCGNYRIPYSIFDNKLYVLIVDRDHRTYIRQQKK